MPGEELEKRCLQVCKKHRAQFDHVTGCEVDVANRSCNIHTEDIVRGSGSNAFACWVFDKCRGTNYTGFFIA